MQLTEITPDNVSHIERAKAVFPDCWTAAEVKAGFAAGRLKGFYAAENGETFGFILFTEGVDDGDIELVFVFPEYRGKGVGKSLVLSAVESLLKFGAKKIFLEVRASNTQAVSLYSGQGFQKINTRKKYYPDGEDAVIMVKEI